MDMNTARRKRFGMWVVEPRTTAMIWCLCGLALLFSLPIVQCVFLFSFSIPAIKIMNLDMGVGFIMETLRQNPVSGALASASGIVSFCGSSIASFCSSGVASFYGSSIASFCSSGVVSFYGSSSISFCGSSIVSFRNSSVVSFCKIPFMLAALGFRLDNRSLHYNHRRKKILKLIKARPGECFYAIRKELGISNGSLVYHLHRLENGGRIFKRKLGRYMRFYPRDSRRRAEDTVLNDNALQAAPRKRALSKNQTAIKIEIEKRPGITQHEIALSLNLSKQVVSYHITVLIRLGHIEAHKNGKSVQCFKNGVPHSGGQVQS